MVILGINAYHGDASAAIVVDGQLVAAAEEERFNRIKHVAGFPTGAVRYCLDAAGLRPGDIDHIALARNPWARLLKKALYAVRMPRLAADRLAALLRFAGIGDDLSEALGVGRGEIKPAFHRIEHHRAHLASSFFVSPFDDAALLSVDGLGDFASTMWGTGRGATLEIRGAISFPHSLGIYYTAVSQYLGFWKYGDEYKVMGLAAYGEPEFGNEFQDIVDLDGRLGFSLGLDYFLHHKTGPEMTWRQGQPVLGRLYSDGLIECLGPARERDSAIEPRHENVAASLQARLEEVMFTLLNRLHTETGSKALCMAGGVAFNCVVNGQIFERTPFEAVYIPPAAGDSGLAVGAAYYVWNHVLGNPRSFEMRHAYWGPGFSPETIEQLLTSRGVTFRKIEDSDELCDWTAGRIAEGKVVGWFQGRMEWGPRALGNRSIVADPRRPEMKDVLNKRIKHREPFRPFSPSVLAECVDEYFEAPAPSPFMLMTYRVRPDKREVIPAPTHVDGTGRVQTVDRGVSPLYWTLIRAFGRRTGVPVVLNTSFNENEPIVCTPEEALECFLRTRMDVLVLGSCVVERERTQ